MTTNGRFLSDELLSRAAFLLLSSSSQARYRRIAHDLAAESGITERLEQDPHLARAAITRIERLWTELISTEQRDIHEFEIAVLLSALSVTGNWDIDTILRAMKATESATTAWLRGLAKHLHAELYAMHNARLAEVVTAWLARPHKQTPGFDPDMIVRAQVEAA